MDRLKSLLRLIALASALCVAIVFVTSCTDNQNGADGSAPADNVETEALEAAIEIAGVITYDGLWFRETLDGSGVRQLDVGEEVVITGEKKADPDNTDRFYFPVRLSDGSEGWTSEWFTIPESVPAVLTREAKVYSEPKLSKLTDNEALKVMVIVAAGSEGETDGFIRVSYANADGYARIDDYIKAESLSFDNRDITAAHLYTLADSVESEDMKSEFLESASGLKSPAFGMLIDRAREGLIPVRMNDATVATVIVLSDTVEFYSEPDRESEVIGSAEMNEILGVNGRSDSEVVIEGETNWWYSLENGGWIWGGDVIVNE